ncbi:MAG: hypothetical protein LWW85_06325 [Marinilabiliales bacterium]|nr:hypothetical protein [Marinilabiliales bacterium]
MAHHEHPTTLNPTERKFREIMQYGDDLLKIELLRYAKAWYQKALTLNVDNDLVKDRMARCDALLAYEKKVIRILLGVAILVVVVVWWIKR